MESRVDLTMDGLKEGIEDALSMGDEVAEAVAPFQELGADVTIVDSTFTTEPPKRDLSAVEEAAIKFTHLLPFVKKLALAADGKKSLARVLHALVEFPLGASTPKLLNQNERQLFALVQEVNGLKTTVLNEIIRNQIPKTGEGTMDVTNETK